MRACMTIGAMLRCLLLTHKSSVSNPAFVLQKEINCYYSIYRAALVAIFCSFSVVAICTIFVAAYRSRHVVLTVALRFNMEWSWWYWSLMSMTNWFPLVHRHCWFRHLACKNRPWNTYNVSIETLNLYSLTLYGWLTVTHGLIWRWSKVKRKY